MEESAEFLQPDGTAREIAEEAIREALRMREVAIPVLDMEGNEWTYRCMVSEALTIIKFKQEGENLPAITFKQSKSKEGGRNSEFVIISVNKEGHRKKVHYGNDGKVKGVENIDSGGQKHGAYPFENLPQNINMRKTINMFLEGLRQIKSELPVLVSAAGSKSMGMESRPAEPKAVESQPLLRKAA